MPAKTRKHSSWLLWEIHVPLCQHTVSFLFPNTKLSQQIRVSSHTLQFGSCEEQINDMTGLFYTKHNKTVEYHVTITPEPLIGLSQTKAIQSTKAKTFGGNFKTVAERKQTPSVGKAKDPQV